MIGFRIGESAQGALAFWPKRLLPNMCAKIH
jgi:hypothetical protein